MLHKKFKQVTYQTRLKNDSSSDHILDESAKLLSQAKRSLFKEILKGEKINDLKSKFIKDFNITARQFNSIRIELEGQIRSNKELLKLQISELKTRINNLKKIVKKIKNKNKLHQKKRKLFNLEKKFEKLQKDLKNNKSRICFGGKKLFKAQFNLDENGYKNHLEWKNDWQKKRNFSFFIVGSKDETLGNQSSQLTQNEENSFDLKLRLPNIFSEKYLIIKKIDFSYGKKEIIDAINKNINRSFLQKAKNPNYKNVGTSINFRFKKDKKSWILFVTFMQEESNWISDSSRGAIGVDINADHLAVSEIDRFGNLIHSQRIPLNTYGKSKNQALAIIGDASKDIVKIAKNSKKPIVLEKLDFQKKKQTLKEKSNKYSRMLSSFSYKKIPEMIFSKAFMEQIEIFFVNPAFTSVIGLVKFKKLYGLSTHSAAALVIARRFLRFSERFPSQKHFDKHLHNASFLPVRDRKKHIWSCYGQIARKMKEVRVAHFRAKKLRSLITKNPNQEIEFSRIVSEILALEPLAKLLGLRIR